MELIRWLPVLPLAVIAFQSFKLSQMLPTPGWRLIAGGAAVLLVLAVLSLSLSMMRIDLWYIRTLGGTLAYTLIAFGFNDLRKALLRLGYGRRRTPEKSKESA